MIKWTGNNIGDEGAINIGKSLMMNTTLFALNLGCVIEKKENECNRKKKQKEKYEIMMKNEQGTELEIQERLR